VGATVRDVMSVSNMICPHCGKIVKLNEGGLTPSHYEHLYETIREVCPGSFQNPRCAESDRRLLWNGKLNPHAK
jgi:hypothetical protein